MANTATMKELQKFPVIFTFKIIGNSGHDFSKSVYELFSEKEGTTFVERESGKGSYMSISVTTHVLDYEELEYFYKKISELDDIKFYV